jgi:hypothetical protein
VNPMGRGDETRRPAGQTPKATGAGGCLSNGATAAGSRRLVRPPLVWYLSPVTDLPRLQPSSWFPTPFFHSC